MVRKKTIITNMPVPISFHFGWKYIYFPIITLSGLGTIFWVQWRDQIFTEPFWDLKVYKEAALNGSHFNLVYHISPEKLNFVYHPYIQMIFSYIDRIFPLEFSLPIFTFCMLAFFVYQYTCFLQSQFGYYRRDISWLSFITPTIITLIFGGTPILALASGNIAVSLHLLTAGSFISFIRNSKQSRLYFFVICIILNSIVKPFFLIYLLLLFVGTKFTRALLCSCIVILIFLMVWFSGRVFFPNAFKLFITALLDATFTRGDLGFSIFSILQDNLGQKLALAFYVSSICLLLLEVFLLGRNINLNFRDSALWFSPIAFTILVTSNPRMKEYDLFLPILMSISWFYIKLSNRFWSFITIYFTFFLFRLFLFHVSRLLPFSIPDPLIYLRYWEFAGLFLLQFGIYIECKIFANKPNIYRK